MPGHMKVCTKCKQELPLDAFPKRSGAKAGIKPQCKPCHNASNRESRAKHLESSRESSRRWREANPERLKARTKQWAEKNPERMRALQVAWQAANRDRVREVQRARLERRPEVRAMRSMSQRIRFMLSGKNSRSTPSIVGYGPSELREHIGRQFLPGMTWDNYGEWHIDHIVPLSDFNITSLDDDEMKSAWALTNLRPLWASENCSKSDRRVFLL